MQTDTQTSVGNHRKTRFGPAARWQIVQEHTAGGMPLALVARKHRVAVGTLYLWRRELMAKPLRLTDPPVDLHAELEAARRRIRQLERALADTACGKAILEDAVEILQKKLVSPASVSPKPSSTKKKRGTR